jgi:sirohydrochlorin ferrochelatase
MKASRSSLVTVRQRLVLDVTHGRDPFPAERRALGIGPDLPAVAVVLRTCAETVVAVGRRVYTVDEEAVAGPLETLRHGFRHSKAEGRRYRGVVLGLVALEEAAHAEIAKALTGRVAGCAKAAAGACGCACRQAPLVAALAMAAGPWSVMATERMGAEAGLTRTVKSAALSERIDDAKAAISAIVAARRPIMSVTRAGVEAGIGEAKEARA